MSLMATEAQLSSLRSFYILLHIGCFFFSPNSTLDPQAETTRGRSPHTKKRRKISPISTANATATSPDDHDPTTTSHPSSAKSSNNGSVVSRTIRSYLKHLQLLLLHKQQQSPPRQPSAPPVPLLPTFPCVYAPTSTPPSSLEKHRNNKDGDHEEIYGSAISNINSMSNRPSFASRSDIFPCPSCGEVFNRAHLLDLHQATKHALSELSDADSSNNIVRLIFQSGWRKAAAAAASRSKSLMAPAEACPVIHRILKIHNSPKTLARFEEYRETVRSRAATRAAGVCVARRSSSNIDEERCMADGNERLRFYCAAYMCGLGKEGNLGTCGSPFCTICQIVRHGFGGNKAAEMDGIATHGTGWAAHGSLPEGLEEDFAFMHVRRAMLVCRVVAGRVALGDGETEKKGAGGGGGDGGFWEDDCYDSVVVVRQDGGGGGGGGGGEELAVFNPRAVLPCFVILYTV